MDVDLSKSISLQEFSSYYLSQRPRSTSTSAPAATSAGANAPIPPAAGASNVPDDLKAAATQHVGAAEMGAMQVQTGGDVFGRQNGGSERGGDEKVGVRGRNIDTQRHSSSEQMFATYVLANRDVLSAVYRFRHSAMLPCCYLCKPCQYYVSALALPSGWCDSTHAQPQQGKGIMPALTHRLSSSQNTSLPSWRQGHRY